MSRTFRLVAPLVGVIILIFVSSTMSYEQQDIRSVLSQFPGSEFLETLFSPVAFTYGGRLISVDNLGLVTFIEFFIRKGMHVFVFGLLAFLLFRLLYGFNVNVFRSSLFSFLFVVGFAVIDEVRQFFHPDRSGMWQDVVLDSFGAMLGIVFALWFYKRKE
ncbi:VanZ family protein [Geomicrobium sediminis]|uniref:VanZ-like domain-containing protein n=1 Tax=Geomicrobium sediminis TaxID=1347788 RepID=A0ABS2PFY4_9BACL|nr:VanZ family protein [Geomicrobium sediminis]MBM7634339.1 hypothetical protein [Geomicrobium sediminis]